MDNIKELQYNNLRKCINENLIKPILGEGYYNMAMDVYTADEETTKDLKRKFDIANYHIKVYRNLFVISLLISIILILIKLL